MKKNFKLVLALVLAAMMIVGMIPAFGAADNLTPAPTLTVSGLGKDDVVTYYQVLKWDVNNTTGDPANGWVWGSFATPDAEKKVAGYLASDVYGTSDGQNKIDFAMAGALANAATTAMTSPAGTNNNGTWTVSGVDAGLYMVIVESKTDGVMYNPIFVAANWVSATETNVSGSSWVVDSAASYSDHAVAKKSEIPFEKTASGHMPAGTLDDTDPYRTDVGEIIDFTITTKIPKYGSNYTNPVFRVEDTLEGLTLEGNAPGYTIVVTGAGVLTAGTDYTLVVASDKKSYSVQFKKSYLDAVGNGGQDITITYSAKVTDEAKKVINWDKNTADLIFSTKPDDTFGLGRLRDKTNHFTFSIDADLFGNENESSTEAIKVGVDRDGNPILESHTYFHQGVHHPLEGAQFKLQKKVTANDGTVSYEDYSNDVFNGTVESDATGRITIRGLDVGEYQLVETSAPSGWIKLQSAVPVVVTADITENVEEVDEFEIEPETGTTVPVKVTYKTNVLNSYSVTVGGSTTTYHIENSNAGLKTSDISRDVTSSDKELMNTKGVELPSTGGIGTTIFYIGGSILVLAAAILLITKRRMGAED